MDKYQYGKSIISSKLRFEFQDNNLKYAKIKEKFQLEIRVYCGRKKIYEVKGNYENTTLNFAIKDIFRNKIEQQCTFHKGYNYYATFKAYELKLIRRPKYEKTDKYVNSEKRKYLFQERINIYF